MEAKRGFNNDDLFFIAEKLDAIKFSLPIPPHTQEEFNDYDLYIIWTKLTGGGSTPGYGQTYANSQGVLPNAPIVWAGIQNNSGVSVAGSNITVANAGVYQFEAVLEVTSSPD